MEYLKLRSCLVMSLLLLLFLPTLSLAKLQLSTLETIKSRGSIYIGTTGDYPPLTWYNSKKRRYEGFDIDMAVQLARFLKVKAEFIPTTWLNMGRDLRINKFDIAMGGISISPQKQAAFLFSAPILPDGIVALTRCSDISKYNTFNKIDLYGVRVMEIKGSRNEDFVRQNLKYARLIYADDAQSIYQQLMKNSADVTFTDSIEANYIQRLRIGLCVSSPQLQTYEEKAYLMDKNDKALLQQVNLWIEAMRTSGQLQAIKNKWLPRS